MMNGTLLDEDNFIHFFQHQNRNRFHNLLKIGIQGEYVQEGIVFEIGALLKCSTMKHTNQEDSGRNQTERDQQRKANNTQAGDRNESMGHQNGQGKKDHSGKHGSDPSSRQSEKKDNKK
jgi:hypothetical protein